LLRIVAILDRGRQSTRCGDRGNGVRMVEIHRRNEGPAISGDNIAQIDLRQPASFSTYTVTGDPASTDVAFIGSAFVAGTDAVTDGGSARSYVFRNRGTIRTSGTM